MKKFLFSFLVLFCTIQTYSQLPQLTDMLYVASNDQYSLVYNRLTSIGCKYVGEEKHNDGSLWWIFSALNEHVWLSKCKSGNNKGWLLYQADTKLYIEDWKPVLREFLYGSQSENNCEGYLFKIENYKIYVHKYEIIMSLCDKEGSYSLAFYPIYTFKQ